MDANLRNVFTSAVMLGLFGVAGAGLVAGVHVLTADRVAENDRLARLRILNEVLPAERYDNDLLSDRVSIRDETLAGGRFPVVVYRARKQGEPVAALFETVAPDGYSGPIRLLVGVGLDGTLTGARILEHRETPGLGDPIDQNHGRWIFGFNGKSLDNPAASAWAVKRDGGAFDQFTGATISPRAVVKAVRQTLLYFQTHREPLFAPKDPAHD